MLRKIRSVISEDKAHADIVRYREKTLSAGAAASAIIGADMIRLDERVHAKCMIPRCPVYNNCAYCPPLAPGIRQIRSILTRYTQAIFFKIDVPPALINQNDMPYKLLMAEIVSKTETQAYYDGYYFALGFDGASCKSTLCPEVDCSALSAGGVCRFPYRSRLSMHGAGMDVFKMAAEQNWPVYPAGRMTQAEDIPSLSYFGLVLIY